MALWGGIVGSSRAVVSRELVNHHNDQGAGQLRGYDDKAEKDLRSTGGMPLCLRIGVTGHRDIRDPDDVRRQVAEAVRWLADELHLAEISRHSPVCLQVITPLAAGGDQIAAEAVRSLGVAGTTLVVPVPADQAAYLESIREDGEAAAAEYNKLRRAPGTVVTKLPHSTADDQGFRKVGQWVVDHCDVLLALWNGKPPPSATVAGPPPGTAAIVSYALSHPREIPVIVVPVVRLRDGETPEPGLPPRQLLVRREDTNVFRSLWWQVLRMQGSKPKGLAPRLVQYGQPEDGRADPDQEERERSFQQSIRSWPLGAKGGRVLRRNALGTTVRHLKRFNARPPQETPPQETKSDFSKLVDAAVHSQTSGVCDAALSIDEWAQARYARADTLAGRYQRVAHGLDYSVYALAAISVIVAASRAIWTAPGSAPALALSVVDVSILLTISVIVVGDLRGRLRDRWVCFRAMAEYLRTYRFFALIEPRRRMSAGEEHRPVTSLGLNEFVGPAWFDRCMQAIWWHRPVPQTSDADLPDLKRVLGAWILDQADYHRRKTEREASLHQRYLFVVAALFIMTVLLAFVHIFAPHSNQLDNALNFVAIGVPGAAAAINSIGAASEHHRHSVRSRAVMHRLYNVYLPAIMAVGTMQNLHEQADTIGNYILGESTDWYELMAIHSVDIPT